MSMLGKVCIGRKAPDFHCEAVHKGAFEEVTLSTYIHPAIKLGTLNPEGPWLILLFIPAAFSFVCPTEVLAFQNCLDEFKDRNCSIVFISVDTKHSLWHWQNVPRQYGGLGGIDIPLLSDATHRLSRDYGVLIEDQGVSLRGMFIIDNEGIVQQITLNNLSVGRSVLEALRLLEAFQAVAKHGVLCPIDWKPSGNTADTINTISNTLTESYEERLANLQSEYLGVQVTDLDAKHKPGDDPKEVVTSSNVTESNKSSHRDSIPTPVFRSVRSNSSSQSPTIQEVTCKRPKQPSPNDGLQHTPSPPARLPASRSNSFQSAYSSSSSPHGKGISPSTTLHPPPNVRSSTARHSRGNNPRLDHRDLNNLFFQSNTSIFQTLTRRVSHASSSDTDSSSGHSTAPSAPIRLTRANTSNSIPLALTQRTKFESLNGNHVVLEFAEPTVSPLGHLYKPPPSLPRAMSWTGPSMSHGWHSPSETLSAAAPSQTRLQATVGAIRRMSTGWTSPRVESGLKKVESGEEVKNSGYFDVVNEGDEA